MCIHHYHPLITGTLALLPELGDPISDDDLDAWVELLRLNVRALYKRQADPPPAPRPADPLEELLGMIPDPAPTSAPATYAEVVASHDPLLHWRPTADAAEARAAELEAERYDLERLEREQIGMIVKHGPTVVLTDEMRAEAAGAPEPERGALEFDRAGRYVRKVHCPYDTGAGECGKECRGEVGLLAHLAGGHDLRGHATRVVEIRRAYVDEAIAAARSLGPGVDAGDDDHQADDTPEPEPEPEPDRIDAITVHPDLLPPEAVADMAGCTIVDDTADAVEIRTITTPTTPPTLEQVAATGSPGATRLLDLKRQALERLGPTTHKVDRHAIADELGVAFGTLERWWAEAYPSPEQPGPATMDPQ